MQCIPIIGTDGKVVTGIAYKIRSIHGLLLDDWGGLTGPSVAALVENKSHPHRLWCLVPTRWEPYCNIMSIHGTVLDDMAGAGGFGALGLVNKVT